MDITHNISAIKKTLPSGVKLIAVSKNKSAENILEAYQTGQRDFAENKVQELTQKYETLPKDIRWHFIGHLQTNKIKYVAPFIDMIHGVDSLKVLAEINKFAEKNQRTIDVLFEIHIAQEDSKFGLTKQELHEILSSNEYLQLTHVRVCGLMGMATFTDDKDVIRNEFGFLHQIFNDVKESFFNDKSYFSELSMGMSDDYLIAIEQGSTMVRVGSNIFGNRIQI